MSKGGDVGALRRWLLEIECRVLVRRCPLEQQRRFLMAIRREIIHSGRRWVFVCEPRILGVAG
jgi:hypothetical protein